MNLRSNEGGEQEDDVQQEIKDFITKQNYKYSGQSEVEKSDEGNQADEERSEEEAEVEQQEVKTELKKNDCTIF